MIALVYLLLHSLPDRQGDARLVAVDGLSGATIGARLIPVAGTTAARPQQQRTQHNTINVTMGFQGLGALPEPRRLPTAKP